MTEYKLGDRVYLKGGDRQGVVCGVAARIYSGQPPAYRVAWDSTPPCPPELEPTGVWSRKYTADELSREPGGE